MYILISVYITLLFIYSNNAIINNEDAICPVCYSKPCNITNTISNLLLYCQVFNSTQCDICNSTCDQCLSTEDSPYVCQCPNIANTTAPTKTPTKAPTTAQPTVINATLPPTQSPTSAPTVFFECSYCNSTSPPPSLQCNGSSKLLMLCNSPTQYQCVVCPTFCSFCFPLLLPTPSYTCTCPLTESPTDIPTKSPTNTPTDAPTSAPTKAPHKHSYSRIVIACLIIAFACILCIIATLACIIIIPDGLRGRVPNRSAATYVSTSNIKRDHVR